MCKFKPNRHSDFVRSLGGVGLFHFTFINDALLYDALVHIQNPSNHM